MRVALLLSLAALLTLPHAAAAPQAQNAGPPAAPPLDFEFFKTKVEPIFLAKRDGHTRCVACYSKGTPMRLQELTPGAATWSEEQSRKNFQIVLPRVDPNGDLNRQSMAEDQEYYLAKGCQPRRIDLDRAIDTSFLDAALARLGRAPVEP